VVPKACAPQADAIIGAASVRAERFKESEGTEGQIALRKLIGLLAFCLSFLIAITVVLFVYYTYGDERGGCERNKVIISMNLILAIFTIVSGTLTAESKNGGILQPAVLSTYTTYLTWSAVSQTTDQCMPTENDPSDWLTLVVGFFLTLMIVFYYSVSEDGAEPDVAEDDDSKPVKYNWSGFHILLALGCCLMQNVLTNWTTIRTSDGGQAGAEVDTGDSSAPVWVQACASYFAVLLYMGYLCIPIIRREESSAATRV